MQRVLLERFAYHPAGTLGRLFLPNGRQLVTVERPWMSNRQSVSCIPEGVYTCVPYDGTRFKDVYLVQDVPNRSAILFHAANRPGELEGCIAPGQSLIPDQVGVLNSRAAMDTLRRVIGAEAFELDIRHFIPEYP